MLPTISISRSPLPRHSSHSPLSRPASSSSGASLSSSFSTSSLLQTRPSHSPLLSTIIASNSHVIPSHILFAALNSAPNTLKRTLNAYAAKLHSPLLRTSKTQHQHHIDSSPPLIPSSLHFQSLNPFEYCLKNNLLDSFRVLFRYIQTDTKLTWLKNCVYIIAEKQCFDIMDFLLKEFWFAEAERYSVNVVKSEYWVRIVWQWLGESRDERDSSVLHYLVQQGEIKDAASSEESTQEKAQDTGNDASSEPSNATPESTPLHSPHSLLSTVKLVCWDWSAFFNAWKFESGKNHQQLLFWINRMVERKEVNVLTMINHQNKFGNTPLHRACISAPKEVVEYLIERGARVNLTNVDQQSPLMFAVMNNRADLLEVLHKHGAKLRHRALFGVTSMHTAAQNGSLECAQFLVDKEPSLVNEYDDARETALLYATKAGQTEMARFLIQKGANVESKVRIGLQSSLHYAAFYGYSDLIEVLVKEGKACLEAKSVEEKTALHYAASQGHADCVRLLLHLGADANICDIHRKTPRDLAASADIARIFDEKIVKKPSLTVRARRPQTLFPTIFDRERKQASGTLLTPTTKRVQDLQMMEIVRTPTSACGSPFGNRRLTLSVQPPTPLSPLPRKSLKRLSSPLAVEEEVCTEIASTPVLENPSRTSSLSVVSVRGPLIPIRSKPPLTGTSSSQKRSSTRLRSRSKSRSPRHTLSRTQLSESCARLAQPRLTSADSTARITPRKKRRKSKKRSKKRCQSTAKSLIRKTLTSLAGSKPRLLTDGVEASFVARSLPMSQPSAVGIGNAMYVHTSTFFGCFDTSAKQWHRLAPGPHRAGMCMFVREDHYVTLFGGRSVLDRTSSGANEVYEYDTKRDKWLRIVTRGDEPAGIHYAAYDAENDQLVVLAPDNVEDYFVLNFQDNVWQKKEIQGSLRPGLRRGATFCHAGGEYFLLIGGTMDPKEQNSVWCFSTDSHSWFPQSTAGENQPNPQLRFHAATFVPASSLVLVHGGELPGESKKRTSVLYTPLQNHLQNALYALSTKTFEWTRLEMRGDPSLYIRDHATALVRPRPDSSSLDLLTVGGKLDPGKLRDIPHKGQQSLMFCFSPVHQDTLTVNHLQLSAK